jgi:hypothetical protein
MTGSKQFVCTLINGAWALEDTNWVFKGGRSKTMMIPKCATYLQLVDKMYESHKVDKNKHLLKLEVAYNNFHPHVVAPTKIEDDEGVEAFFCYCEQNTGKMVPLCLTMLPNDMTLDPLPSLSVNKSVRFADISCPEKLASINNGGSQVGTNAHDTFAHVDIDIPSGSPTGVGEEVFPLDTGYDDSQPYYNNFNTDHFPE